MRGVADTPWGLTGGQDYPLPPTPPLHGFHDNAPPRRDQHLCRVGDIPRPPSHTRHVPAATPIHNTPAHQLQGAVLSHPYGAALLLRTRGVPTAAPSALVPVPVYPGGPRGLPALTVHALRHSHSEFE